MKYKRMLKIRKTEGSAGAGQDIAERTGEERRDERDRGRAPSGHGPVMGRQVAPSLPGGGNKRAADPFQVRKAAMDPEGDHEESQENGKGYGLHDRREPAGFRAEGVLVPSPSIRSSTPACYCGDGALPGKFRWEGMSGGQTTRRSPGSEM